MNDNKDYVREFLYGTSSRQFDRETTKASIYMDERMEGWIGIPHGGISMGIMTDLALSLNGFPKNNELLFPFTADFRLGGANLKIGNTLHFQVAPMMAGRRERLPSMVTPFPICLLLLIMGRKTAGTETCLPHLFPNISMK